MANYVQVNKNDYEIHQFLGGYYGIVHKETNEKVKGGDSANEDDYNLSYFEELYNRWDGKLLVESEDYRYIDL